MNILEVVIYFLRKRYCQGLHWMMWSLLTCCLFPLVYNRGLWITLPERRIKGVSAQPVTSTPNPHLLWLTWLQTVPDQLHGSTCVSEHKYQLSHLSFYPTFPSSSTCLWYIAKPNFFALKEIPGVESPNQLFLERGAAFNLVSKAVIRLHCYSLWEIKQSDGSSLLPTPGHWGRLMCPENVLLLSKPRARLFPGFLYSIR